MNGIKRTFVSIFGGESNSHIILNKIEEVDSSLFLYEDGINIKEIFLSFLENGRGNGNVCFYASEPANAARLTTQKGCFTFSFKPNVFFPNTAQFKQKFEKICDLIEKRSCALRLVADWGNIRNYSDKESGIIECVQKIVEKASEKVPKPWRKSFGDVKAKQKDFSRNFPIVFINAFNLASISNELLNQLLGMHKRVILLTRNGFMTSVPGFVSVKGSEEPASEALPENVLEQVVKRNLELVLLSMLEKRRMSGYLLIKEVSSQFHILLSQGTLYPLLYSLEKSGLLKVNNGKGREKVYELTEKGVEYAKKNFAHFRKAYSLLLGLE